MTDHDAIRDAAGAWVLGALDEEEAWSFAAHLEVCDSCRQEVERLQVAADALPLGAPAMEPPPALKARLMSIVEEEARAARVPEAVPRPRERRWFDVLFARPGFALAAACLLLVVGGVAGFALSGSSDETTTVAFQGSGEAELVQRDGEASVRVTNLDPPPSGRVYQLWIKRPGNPAPQPDAVFTVDREGRGSVALEGDVDGAEAVLVTTEPNGGSDEPSSQPLLSAKPA